MIKKYREWKNHKTILLESFSPSYYAKYFILPWPKYLINLACIHYFLWGYKSKQPNEWFNASHYESMYPDVAIDYHPWLHYLTIGILQKRKPIKYLRNEYELEELFSISNKDLQNLKDKDILKLFFDKQHYIRQLKLYKFIPFKSYLINHYLNKGHYHHLSPSPLFNSSFYVSQVSFPPYTSPFIHYLKHGIQNGIQGHPEVKNYDEHYILEEKRHIANIQNEPISFNYNPLISIVIPVFNPPIKHFKSAIDSIINQLYDNWEICICDDASTDNVLIEYLNSLKKHTKIRVTRNAQNKHISNSSNEAINIAKGEFIALLDHDDLLNKHALFHVVKKLNKNPNLNLIYSDEDKISENGFRYDRYPKSDWNYPLLLSQNYICHLTVIRKAIVDNIGGFKEGVEGSQDYDLILRIIEKIDQKTIAHIPHVLYHWRAIQGSTALNLNQKNYAYEAGKKALTEHLIRTNKTGKVTNDINSSGYYNVDWDIVIPPKITIIIGQPQNENQIINLLQEIKKTSYSNYDILIQINNKNDTLKQRFENLSDQYHFKITHETNIKNLNTELILFIAPHITPLKTDFLEKLSNALSSYSEGNFATGQIIDSNDNILYPNRSDLKYPQLQQQIPSLINSFYLVKKEHFPLSKVLDDSNSILQNAIYLPNVKVLSNS